jgi:MFS family permease
LSFIREFKLWRKLSHTLRPVLIVTLFLNIYAAFFWTVGPLLASTLTTLGAFDGVFMAAHLLPALIGGWFIGSITTRFGQKRTAIVAIGCGSLVLTGILFTTTDLLLIAVTLTSSFFVSLALPAINGAFADYIAEARAISTEIETVEDSFTNMGYIIGPITAGILSDIFGYKAAFAVLGVLGVIIALVLWRITPRHLHVTSIVKEY